MLVKFIEIFFIFVPWFLEMVESDRLLWIRVLEMITWNFLEDLFLTNWPFWMVENKNAKLEMTCPKFLIINQEPVRHHHRSPVNQLIFTKYDYKTCLYKTQRVKLVRNVLIFEIRGQNMCYKVPAGDNVTSWSCHELRICHENVLEWTQMTSCDRESWRSYEILFRNHVRVEGGAIKNIKGDKGAETMKNPGPTSKSFWKSFLVPPM